MQRLLTPCVFKDMYSTTFGKFIGGAQQSNTAVSLPPANACQTGGQQHVLAAPSGAEVSV